MLNLVERKETPRLQKVRVSNYETPFYPQSEQVSLIKAKSYNAMLRVPRVCIGSYLKSVLRLNFSFWIPVMQTPYIYVSNDVRIFEAKMSPRAKQFDTSCFDNWFFVFKRVACFGLHTDHAHAHTVPKTHITEDNAYKVLHKTQQYHNKPGCHIQRLIYVI